MLQIAVLKDNVVAVFVDGNKVWEGPISEWAKALASPIQPPNPFAPKAA